MPVVYLEIVTILPIISYQHLLTCEQTCLRCLMGGTYFFASLLYLNISFANKKLSPPFYSECLVLTPFAVYHCVNLHFLSIRKTLSNQTFLRSTYQNLQNLKVNLKVAIISLVYTYFDEAFGIFIFLNIFPC